MSEQESTYQFDLYNVRRSGQSGIEASMSFRLSDEGNGGGASWCGTSAGEAASIIVTEVERHLPARVHIARSERHVSDISDRCIGAVRQCVHNLARLRKLPITVAL